MPEKSNEDTTNTDATSLYLITQLESLTDTFVSLYNYDSHEFVVNKIEREHIPLNGDEVNMIPFRVDELFGFVDKNNPKKWLIKPQFDQVFAVYPEGAIVKKGNGYGLINIKNEWIIKPDYKNLLKEGNIYHGISLNMIDSTLPSPYNRFMYNAYFNDSGYFLFSEKAHDFKSFIGQDTLAWFRFGSTYNVRSRSGKLIKSFKNRCFLGVYDNLLLFLESGKYKAYDDQDHLIFSLLAKDIFTNGIYKINDQLYGLVGTEGDYFFCDARGNPMPYGRFSRSVGFFSSYPEYFNQSYFVLQDREKDLIGVIDRTGKILIDFKYNYISSFQEGLAFCSTDKQTFIIDTTGTIIKEVTKMISPKMIKKLSQELFQEIGFHEGLCVSKDMVLFEGDTTKGEPKYYVDGKSFYYYYFNANGEVVCKLSPDIQFVGPFSEGLAVAVNKEKVLGFINKTGKWIITPEYEIAVAGAYPMPYLVIPKFIGGFAYIKAFKGYIDKTGKKYFSGKRMQDLYDFSH